MWRDYLGFVGAVLAVLNGMIAIVVAVLPVRRSVIKLRLGVTALVLGGLAVGATGFSWFDSHARHERQLSEGREVRTRLEAFLTQGKALLVEIADPQKELPNRAADEWAQRNEIYLREKLGDIYVARFRKDTAELYGDAAIAPARLAYWRAVRNRLVNLETMIAELPSPRRTNPVSTPRL
jgi:hypothetical protein